MYGEWWEPKFNMEDGISVCGSEISVPRFPPWRYPGSEHSEQGPSICGTVPSRWVGDHESSSYQLG